MILDSMQMKTRPKLAPEPTQLVHLLNPHCKCCVYISCYVTVLLYINRPLTALLLLVTLLACSCKPLHCAWCPQDVVTFAKAILTTYKSCTLLLYKSP